LITEAKETGLYTIFINYNSTGIFVGVTWCLLWCLWFFNWDR